MILDPIPFRSYSRPEILDPIPFRSYSFFDFIYYSSSKLVRVKWIDSPVELWQNLEKNASQIMIFLPRLQNVGSENNKIYFALEK